ncbi:LLM class flavin-dependent oxidoreductase [Amycolatopsis sp. NPDC058278]|uniref:LLM class flavin-dependent oxidoreductase n=1 Tax=Amycolatopsis sp. NPDC058278 TaxID=3346417 RepID=UPI0036D817E2
MTPSLRVGVQYTPRADQNISSIVRAAVEIEAMGYDTISLPDHLARADGGQPVALPDPVALLARLAADTRTIGLGTMTLLDALRHPAQIVRSAATLQRITAGRFELGLGAGWLGSDLAVLGETARTRLDTLNRTLTLIRHAWPGPGTPDTGEEQGDTAARAAAAANAAGIPAPTLVVAAGGPRMLRLAAATADVVALTVPTWDRATGRPTAASITAQMDIVRHASPAGWPPPGFHLQIRELPAAALADPDADWWVLGGSPAEAAETLHRRIAAGVGYLSVCTNDLGLLRRFADTVLPLVMS